MARYTQLNTQQIKHLAGSYNLDIDSYLPMQGGAANSSYLLQSAQGKYVLTVYEDKPMVQVENMGLLLWELAKHNFPTVIAVPTNDGNAATVFEGKPVLVKEYIQGRVLQHMDAAMLAQIGGALARLHQIPSPDYLRTQHPYGLEVFPTFIGLDIDAEYDAWLSKRLAYLKEHTPTNLPRALIHGDLFYDNVLFYNGKLKAMIDFEEVCNYHKVFDLGMAFLGICTVDGKLNLEHAHAVLSGYLDTGNLGETERNALQLMTETAAVATACWRFWKYNLHDPTPERAQTHWEMAGIADHVHAIPEEDFMARVVGD